MLKEGNPHPPEIKMDLGPVRQTELENKYYIRFPGARRKRFWFSSLREEK